MARSARRSPVWRGLQAGSEAREFLAEFLPEGGGQIVDGPLQVNERVLDLDLRRDAALAHLVGQPQRFHPRIYGAFGPGTQIAVERIQRPADPQDVIDDAAPLCFGRVGRQHRLDADRGQQPPKRRRGNAVAAQLLEGVAQRHGRPGLLLLVGEQPANPLPLLAQVDQVEKQAESVRHLRSLDQRQAVDLLLVGSEPGGVRVLADFLGKLAQVLDRRENLRAALLAGHGAQARGQKPHLSPQRLVHGFSPQSRPVAFAASSLQEVECGELQFAHGGAVLQDCAGPPGPAWAGRGRPARAWTPGVDARPTRNGRCCQGLSGTGHWPCGSRSPWSASAA